MWPSWYGLMYVISFAAAFLLLPVLQKYRSLHLTKDDWLYVLALGVTGVVAGGRLGYVIFYEPAYFLANPGDIAAIWQGGMSSHGGFIGVGIALFIASRHLKIDFFALLDVVVVPAALGLALGRLGNYINQELFIGGLAGFAILKNCIIASLSYWTLVNTKYIGRVGAVFFISYGVLRFLVEYLRVDEWPEIFGLTYGQFLTIPLFFLGLWLFKISRMNKSV